MNVWTNSIELAVRIAEDTTFDPNSVSPGVEGFLMTGLMALLVIGLGFVLVRRMRKNAYRHDVRDEIEAELAERAEAEAAGAGETADAAESAPDRGDAGAPGATGAAGLDGSDNSAQK